MAIDPSAEYPAQIITSDAGWPYGKAQNDSVPGDGSGTPLEAEWVSDLFGWQQALLDEASVTPSGNPDKVGASQYMAAMHLLFADKSAESIPSIFNNDVTFNGTVTTNDDVTVNGNITFNGTSLFNGNTILGDVSGDIVQVKATATFVPQARFLGGITTHDGASAYGAAVVGNVTANGWLEVGTTLLVAGTSLFEDEITARAGLTTYNAVSEEYAAIVTGALTAHGLTTINSSLYVDATIRAGAGSHIPRKMYVMGDADATIAFSTATLIEIPDGVLTGNRALTLTGAGVPDGAVYEVYTRESTYSVLVNGSANMQLGTQYSYAAFRVRGGTVELMMSAS